MCLLITRRLLITIITLVFSLCSYAAILPKDNIKEIREIAKTLQEKRVNKIHHLRRQFSSPIRVKKLKPRPSRLQEKGKNRSSINKPLQIHFKKKPLNFRSVAKKPLFDLPVTYNTQVKKWISRYQSSGKHWYSKWLSRSHRYLPIMQKDLTQRGLPQDLAYIAMIESGFSSRAVSSASAVGYWQFIRSTARRYGLKIDWWIDERRDYKKSTHAAASYLGDLYKMFGSWYLTAAAYNMGENRLKRLIKKHHTRNFWVLASKKDFPSETRDYIPKLLAAIFVAKAPKLYGFHNIKPLKPYRFDYFYIPGGVDIHNLARSIGVGRKTLLRLNPELIKGFVPSYINNHRIRIPRGLTSKVSKYIRSHMQTMSPK